MEGSRWVEVTLEDTATSPAWEATMTTVRFNFVHFFFLYIYIFSHFSGSHTFIPVLLQIARVEWTAVIMAAAADQSAWMAWEEAGACRCFIWVLGRLVFVLCDYDYGKNQIHSLPTCTLNLIVGISIAIPAIPEVKGQPLSSSHGDCPLPPLVMLVNILQIYRSETVESWPRMARGAASPIFIMRKELCWNWFLK